MKLDLDCGADFSLRMRHILAQRRLKPKSTVKD